MVIKSSGPLNNTQSIIWLCMCFAVSVIFFMVLISIQKLCLSGFFWSGIQKYRFLWRWYRLINHLINTWQSVYVMMTVAVMYTKENPVWNNRQGFLLISLESKVLSLEPKTPDLRLLTHDFRLMGLHHAAHTAAAHRRACRCFFRIISQYALGSQ